MTKEQNQPVRHLFLDLEDTVITPVMEGWANAELINTDKVKQFVNDWKPHYLHIYSFAIYNDFDVRAFHTFVKKRLESVLGMPIGWTPRLDHEILESCSSQKSLARKTVTRQDVCDFWGKQDSFRLFVRDRLGGTGRTPVDVVLIDDMVTPETFAYPSLGVSGRLIDIADL